MDGLFYEGRGEFEDLVLVKVCYGVYDTAVGEVGMVVLLNETLGNDYSEGFDAFNAVYGGKGVFF